jgi:hypothetical protein
MTYARFQSAMNAPAQGVTRRAHVEASARAGNAAAQAALTEPPFPAALTYLWEWCMELRAGLGAGMDGLAWVTWSVVDAWRVLTDRSPQPHEVQALFALDAAMRAQPTDPSARDAEIERPAITAWPTKKPSEAPHG